MQHFMQSAGVVLDDTSKLTLAPSAALHYRPAPPVLAGAVMVTLVATPAAATTVIVGALGALEAERGWGRIQVSGRDQHFNSRQSTRLHLAPSSAPSTPSAHIAGAVYVTGAPAALCPAALMAYA